MAVIVMDKATDVRDTICKYFLLSIVVDSAYYPMPRGSSLATSHGGEDQIQRCTSCRDWHVARLSSASTL